MVSRSLTRKGTRAPCVASPVLATEPPERSPSLESTCVPQSLDFGSMHFDLVSLSSRGCAGQEDNEPGVSVLAGRVRAGGVLQWQDRSGDRHEYHQGTAGHRLCH